MTAKPNEEAAKFANFTPYHRWVLSSRIPDYGPEQAEVPHPVEISRKEDGDRRDNYG
jgi:hypothetical protein